MLKANQFKFWWIHCFGNLLLFIALSLSSVNMHLECRISSGFTIIFVTCCIEFYIFSNDDAVVLWFYTYICVLTAFFFLIRGILTWNKKAVYSTMIARKRQLVDYKQIYFKLDWFLFSLYFSDFRSRKGETLSKADL